MATTLRFEAAGSDLRLLVDRALGVLIESWDPQRGLVRTGRGALPALAAGWGAQERLARPFLTGDGRRWVLGDERDALSLLERVESAWRPAAIEGDLAGLDWRRRQPVTNGHPLVQRLVAPDGTEALLELPGVLVYAGRGVWRFAALQAQERGRPWSQPAWTPCGEGLVCGAGPRGWLVRSGGLGSPPPGVHPAPERVHGRFPGGAWVALTADEVLVAGTHPVPLQRARVIAARGQDDRLLVQGWLPGRSWVLAELDSAGRLTVLHEDAAGLRAPHGPVVTLEARSWWSDERGLLRRWDTQGIRALPLGAVLEGVDPAGRAWLRGRGGELAFALSLDLAELDAWLERPARAPLERVANEHRAATLDPQGRLRVLRVVAQGPGEPAQRPVHERRVLRFHMRAGGEWIPVQPVDEYVDRRCARHWCPRCHGGQDADVRRAPPAELPTRPPGGLTPEGQVAPPAALLRRPDGSAWLLAPVGLVALEPAGEERWRPAAVDPGVPARPWVQDRDGEVWLLEGEGEALLRAPLP